ncbi:MAG: iron transporter FeoA [Bacillaceae bacterium G1]|nr:ferrous iron transport protein A [Bacillota bacterium]OJF17694.1 MAG: iron transporter FeoA [Bacillaceae bacterium G1]
MPSAGAKPLSDMKPGEQWVITELTIQGTMRRRLLDLGFIPGATVKMLRRSPLGDPAAFMVNRTVIALRKEESSQIFGMPTPSERG